MKDIIKKIQNNPIRKLEDLVTKFFLFGTSFVLLLLSQSIFLASINAFKLIPMLIACVISLVVSITFLNFIRKEFHFFPRASFLLILILIILSLIMIFYPHDNFGGTDNGIYINLAYYLAKNGSFETPAYLNGLAPGIEGAKNSLPAYRIWLATQKLLIGAPVAVRGNLLLIILGLLSFFSVASVIKDKKVGLMSIVFFVTSMPFLWFSRETMTENLAFFLLWTVIFFFLVFFKTRKIVFFVYLIINLFLLCFTRPEGILVSFSTLFALLFFMIYKKIFSKRKLLLITFGFLMFFVFFFVAYKYSYVTNIVNVIKITSNAVITDILYLINGKPFLMQRYPLFFVHMLIKYNFFLVIFFIFIVSFKLLFFSKNKGANNQYFFALLIIIAPEFYKLINPSIQILQPWFYRRYLYAILPLGYLSLSFFLCNLKNKRNSIIIFCLFIIINLILSYPIIFLKHNWSLYEAMNKITNIVSSNDLIIIKNERILGHYYPQYYLIMQKSIRAIYTFDMNNKELSLKNKTYKGYSFDKLYFLSDKHDDSYKNYSIVNKQTIDVDFSQLKPSCELEYMGYEFGTKNYSLIPYTYALNYCKYPKNEIIKLKKQLYLYRLN